MDIERLRLDELDDFAKWAKTDGWEVHRGRGAHSVLGLSRPGNDVENHGARAQLYIFGYLEGFRLAHSTVEEVTAERRGAELVRRYKADRGHAPLARLNVSEESRGLALRILDLVSFIYSGQEGTRFREAEVAEAQRELSAVAQQLGLDVAEGLKDALRPQGGNP